MIRNFSKINDVITCKCMYFVNFMVMVYPASRATSLLAAICSVSVTRVQLKVEAHYNYTLQLTAVAFIILLHSFKGSWLASATTLSLNVHSPPVHCYSLPMILFETTQFAEKNPKIKVFNPTVNRHIIFTGISITQTKDKWCVKQSFLPSMSKLK